jgi:NhaP-type Na+/H+ or K+/H+ antiporter
VSRSLRRLSNEPRIEYRRDLITGSWLQIIPVAGAGLAYGIAAALGGSGFIAAFVAGAFFGALVPAESEQASRLNEELGALLGGVTFLIFGAVLLGPALEHVSWQIALYAVLSLTLVSMLPVAVALIRTDARTPTVGFLGWFGPRGLASIVFAVIVVEEAHLPGAETILAATYVTIGLSVISARNHRRAPGQPLRPLVRIPFAGAPPGHGEPALASPADTRDG